MVKIPRDAELFFKKQKVVMVSTLDPNGNINTSVKGIANLDAEKGIIYIVDLFNGKTRRNLKSNDNITIAALDYDRFKGWQIKGTAIEHESEETEALLAHWTSSITSRIADRIILNMRKGKKTLLKHCEKTLPKPKYIIEIKAKTLFDLAKGSGKIQNA